MNDIIKQRGDQKIITKTLTILPSCNINRSISNEISRDILVRVSG